MPIISELKSINRLEAAGFSHDQAIAIVEVTGKARSQTYVNSCRELQTARAWQDFEAARNRVIQEKRKLEHTFAAILIPLLATLVVVVTMILSHG